MTSLRRVELVSLTSGSIGKSLRRLKLVGFRYVPISFRYVPVGTSLPRLKFFDFIYVPVRRRDEVTVWSRALILVIKMDQLYFGTRQYVFSASTVVQSHEGTS